MVQVEHKMSFQEQVGKIATPIFIFLSHVGHLLFQKFKPKLTI